MPLGLFSARAGDLFLAFIGRKLHIDIAYKNHSGLMSCFVLRHIELDSPVFKPKNSDITLGCRSAIIKPGFEGLIKRRAIRLECSLRDASFLQLKEKIESDVDLTDLTSFFQEDSFSIIERLSGEPYGAIYITLIVHDVVAEFPHFEARSDNIRLYASGSISDSGNFNIKLKAFFSPYVVSGLPEALASLLTEESGGWASYSASLVSGQKKPFLKLESDRFKVEFEKIETR